MKLRLTCFTIAYCSSVRYVSEPSWNTLICCPLIVCKYSFNAWICPFDIDWLTSFVALFLNTLLAWSIMSSLCKRNRLYNFKFRHYQSQVHQGLNVEKGWPKNLSRSRSTLPPERLHTLRWEQERYRPNKWQESIIGPSEGRESCLTEWYSEIQEFQISLVVGILFFQLLCCPE
jgi:hypothetical protein